MTNPTPSLACILLVLATGTAPAGAGAVKYSLLATSKTSTMEKELNEAAEAGFRLVGVMGGETSFGGNEVVAITQRDDGTPVGTSRYAYRLLATSKTSTMQKEMQEAADGGYRYVGQTVFSSAFGGAEVVVILERPPVPDPQKLEYLLLATTKTSTMQKELSAAGESGFLFVGTTVSRTKLGGNEIVTILQRPVAP